MSRRSGYYLQTGCTEKEASAAVWDGGDDNIDAAYFDTSASRVIFVQAKWINKGAGEPEAKEIGSFVKGVRDSIEQDDTNFHTRLHARFADIALRLGTPGTLVHLVVVSTGASQLSHHGDSVLQDFLKELNGDDPEPIASSEVVGLSEVYEGLASDPSQATVPLDATILEWSYVPSPFPAYFGIIDGLQLKGWWKSYGRRVVSGNIRHALGATEVNTEIRQTATSGPEKFRYFNNGITLVADEKWKAPARAASRSAGYSRSRERRLLTGRKPSAPSQELTTIRHSATCESRSG